jgi:hypothetical protein
VLRRGGRLNIFFRASAWLQPTQAPGHFGSSTCDAANYLRFQKRHSMDIGVVIESFG